MIKIYNLVIFILLIITKDLIKNIENIFIKKFRNKILDLLIFIIVNMLKDKNIIR